MAEILTRQFGPLEYDPAAVIEFPAGLPGFEAQRKFVLIERPSVAPILFLESLDSPELCFPAVPISAIDPQYELAMTPEDARLLGSDRLENVVCLAILTAAPEGPLTANLLAPVVIDPQSRRAVQAVRMDKRYSHRHSVGQEPACS
ncbi:MAG TPA: flagellar assembly protein FliW [Bryobacteraceae bacterium]|jgi:flagellar assembly factor FliW|nr:flagellar assembly protein FliW [Bryobacteraceae bacterium]